MKLVLYFLSYLMLVNCSGQKNTLNNSKTNGMSEKIDIEKMKSISNKSDATVVGANGQATHTTEYEHSETLSNTAIQTFSGNDINGYVIKETHPSKPFVMYKEYYKNGYLKLKGETFKQGNFKNGIWYAFDDSGKSLTEINYDAGYKFAIDDVLKVLDEKKINIHHKDTRVMRTENTDKPIWTVQWRENPEQKEMMKLDGIDGKILERNSYKHPDK
jgi:hypothetical protein